MSRDGARARLLEETRRLLDRHAAARRAVEGRAEKPPGPGDVFVLERTADFDLEWAVLDRHDSDPRLLVVPADGCSLVGSGDVEVPESAPFGPLVLRCRFARWLDAGLFETGVRTGVLEPGDVARARHKCSEIERTAVTGSISEREVDEDPEYQDWVEDVLMPARLALASASSGSRTRSS